MIVLLLGVALAQDFEVPRKPVRELDEEHDCTEKLPMIAGTTTECDGVLLPPAYHAYLEDHLPYSYQLQVRLIAAQVIAESDAKHAARQVEWRDLKLAEPRPIRTVEAVGLIAVGAGAVLTGAWALGEISAAQ